MDKLSPLLYRGVRKEGGETTLKPRNLILGGHHQGSVFESGDDR